MDMFQFAYRANRSADDAVFLCLHSILQHLVAPATYSRILFIEFRSVFYTIVHLKLFDNLQVLRINTSLYATGF